MTSRHFVSFGYETPYDPYFYMKFRLFFIPYNFIDQQDTSNFNERNLIFSFSLVASSFTKIGKWKMILKGGPKWRNAKRKISSAHNLRSQIIIFINNKKRGENRYNVIAYHILPDYAARNIFYNSGVFGLVRFFVYVGCDFCCHAFLSYFEIFSCIFYIRVFR